MSTGGLKDVPRPALVLALAGATPFVAAPIAMLFGPDWLKLTAYVHAINYAAIALGFVGAVHWGLAMTAASADWRWYGAATLPALAGWLALGLIQPAPKLLLLGFGFAGVYMADVRAVRAGAAPGWYLGLRNPLTVVVLVSLLAMLAAVWRG